MLFVMASLAFASPRVIASPPSEARVLFLQGRAERAATKGAAAEALAIGDRLREGDVLRTFADSRLELGLPDGSRVRLAADTQVTLAAATVGGGAGRRIRIAVALGRIWARVVKAAAGEGTFEVETRNAVAGVRGTAFALLAAADFSAVVRVYTGSVGVRPSERGASSGAPRRPIPGPQRIDRARWEEVVAGAMRQVKISALGDLAPAEDFEDAGADLEWAQWNQARDAELR